MNNPGIIFKRTLYDHRRSIFWWSFGMALLAFYVTIVYPMISEFEQINELIENPIFAALLGDLGELDYTSPEGFLGIEFFSWAPLVLAVFAVTFGGNIVGGEEERGTLDLLLAAPIPRWQVIVEKSATFVVALVIIVAASGLGIILGVAITPDLAIDSMKIAGAALNMLPVILFMAALTLFLSTVLRARGQAGGIAAAIIVISYFLNSFADMADSGILKTLKSVSFYSYYNPFSVLIDGIRWGNFALLLGLAVLLFGLALYFFQRRDIAV